MTTLNFLYRGTLLNGTVFDESGDEPHEIISGRSKVMPLMEQALLEMAPDEERVIELAAKDAYGEFDKSAVQEVPTYKIPNGSNMPEGEMILWTSPRNNKPIPAKVSRIENQIAYLDFNHPLAGQDVVYWLKLISRVD